MNPLLFADWGKINRILCCIMWMIALMLTIVILAHVVPQPHGSVNHQHVIAR